MKYRFLRTRTYRYNVWGYMENDTFLSYHFHTNYSKYTHYTALECVNINVGYFRQDFDPNKLEDKRKLACFNHLCLYYIMELSRSFNE